MHRPLAVLLPLSLVACAATGEGDDSFDDALVQEYRSALPSAERLGSGIPTPESRAGALALEADSDIARLAIEAAVAVNLPAAMIVTTLEVITAFPPTSYDAERRELVWGPWDNDHGVGKVLVYVAENDADADFRYSYAFARLMGDDRSAVVPVIAGGATPDPDDPDRGAGVTLWDLDANNAFDLEHDPDFDPDARRAQGRIVMLYGAGEDDGSRFAFNVAVLRDFVDDDAEAGTDPADSDFLYGTAVDPEGARWHFMDWTITGDLCDAAADSCFEGNVVDDLDETFALRAAFLGTAGRGEAAVSGGDLEADVSLVDCWDTFMTTEYYAVEAGTLAVTEGACAGGDDVTLAERGVPTLDDLDPELMDVLDCVATEGIDACE